MPIYTVTVTKAHMVEYRADVEIEEVTTWKAEQCAEEMNKAGNLPWREVSDRQVHETEFSAVPTPPRVRTFDVVMSPGLGDPTKHVVSVMLAFPANWRPELATAEGQMLRDAIVKRLQETATLGVYVASTLGEG